ncbi:MAG TPA: response regulator [Dehalococcoidia bacterium]|nr:response regulator [Dehalococcoidia bacterium]
MKLTEVELAGVAGVEPANAQRLAERLERAGLLVRSVEREQTLYSLAPPWEQRQRRTRPLILLVEDHTSVAGMTEALLGSEGYNVVLARNPVEAHALLRNVAFDLILTDSFSPTLDLAMRVLRPLLRRATGTPVVLFTAHHWNNARVQAEGFSEIITKPFDVEAFLARVEQLVGAHRAP